VLAIACYAILLRLFAETGTVLEDRAFLRGLVTIFGIFGYEFIGIGALLGHN
jgi:hypothetical protein